MDRIKIINDKCLRCYSANLVGSPVSNNDGAYKTCIDCGSFMDIYNYFSFSIFSNEARCYLIYFSKMTEIHFKEKILYFKFLLPPDITDDRIKAYILYS